MIFDLFSICSKSLEEKGDALKALNSPVQGPDRSRLTLYVQGRHPILTSHLVKAVVELQKMLLASKSDEEGKKSSLSTYKDSLDMATSTFVEMVHSLTVTSEVDGGCKRPSLRDREQHFEAIVNTVEVSKIVLTFVLVYFHDFSSF